MTEITLTQGLVTLIDDTDIELVSQFSWYANWNGRYFYASSYSAKHQPQWFRMHRLLMQPPRGLQVDHINRNTLDNRRENLRICTSGQNKCNTSIRSTNTSGYRGVYPVTRRIGKWAAQITFQYHTKYLGDFDTPELAAHCYDVAAIKAFGEFATLNFPEVVL